jgi:hypothetical protein
VAHRQRRDREEVGAIAPVGSRLIDELEVRLVDERSRRKRPALGAGDELPVCNRAKLLVQERDELIHRALSSAPQLREHVGARRWYVVFVSTGWLLGRTRAALDVGFRHEFSLPM